MDCFGAVDDNQTCSTAGVVPASASFSTAMCDPHHRPVGHMTKDYGYGPLVASGHHIHPRVVWIVFSKAVRVNGFSSRVIPRFNTSRSAISSPV